MIKLPSKRKIWGVSALLVFGFAAGALATDGIDKVEAILRPDYQIKIDGRTVNFEQSVLIYNNESYLPLRAIGTALDAKIGWKKEAKTILINNKAAANTTNNGSTGTSTENAATSPTPTPVPSVSNKTYPKEIKFVDVITYEVTFNDKKYPLLVNNVDGALYFRYDDLLPLHLDLRGVKVTKEKFTQQLYVPADELRTRWTQPEQFTLLNGPVITESDEDKVEFLERSVPDSRSGTKVHYIRPLGHTNDYEYLYQSMDKSFYVRQVTIKQNSNDSWYTSEYKLLDLYIDEDEDE